MRYEEVEVFFDESEYGEVIDGVMDVKYYVDDDFCFKRVDYCGESLIHRANDRDSLFRYLTGFRACKGTIESQAVTVHLLCGSRYHSIQMVENINEHSLYLKSRYGLNLGELVFLPNGFAIKAMNEEWEYVLFRKLKQWLKEKVE